MPLIYEGDTTDNFGRYLPTPFIEKILIEDGGFELTFAVFLTVDDEQDIEEYKDWLNDELIFNAMLAINKSPEGYENLIGGKNVFSYYKVAAESNSETSNIYLQQLDFFSSGHVDELYDSDGNRVLKYQAVIDGNSVTPPEISGPDATTASCCDAEGNTRSVGECCELPSQCMSGNCVDGVCKQGEKIIGEVCSTGVECATGVCCDDKCHSQTGCTGTAKRYDGAEASCEETYDTSSIVTTGERTQAENWGAAAGLTRTDNGTVSGEASETGGRN